jgi:undecaprenyl-diphosphatase
MSWWQAIILGIIQGITEFLPISSSGHLVLTEKIMGLTDTNMLSFYSFLHVGTLASVFIVMRLEIASILRNIFGKMTWLLLLATVPAVVFALLFKDFIEKSFGGETLGIEFVFSGFVLLIALLVKEGDKSIDQIEWGDSLAAGVGQAIAILPAVTRSGTSMAALLMRKVKREDAIRFAFLMSIPAILGSLILDIVDIFKGELSISSDQTLPITLGVIFAGLAGFAIMRFMIKHLSRIGIAICGGYVAILGIMIMMDQSVFHLIF